MDEIKKIIHIDMDAFYASVEQRDNPELRGKPVIVGGDPHSRGVVATCSYEARAYGIYSAMPAKIAQKRCPYAIFVRPRFDVYREVSEQIRDIFHRYTDLVEPLSLDEAFLDVTNPKIPIKYATTIAKFIKRDILIETGLSASAGVSYNKFLAKLASDYQKPNGFTVIMPGDAQQFLDKLPIEKFFGIGKVTSKTLKTLGIKNGYDLRQMSLYDLEKIFKSRGYFYYNFARGIDNRPVEPYRERKSVGSETTLDHNYRLDEEEIVDILDELCLDVSNRITYLNKLGKTVTLKMKFEDFTQITRSLSLEHGISSHEDIRTNIYNLFRNIPQNNLQIRLVGVTLSNLIDINETCHNITLFEYMKNIEDDKK